MLANPKEILRDAEKNHYAIAGFNTPTLEGLTAVIVAAETVDAPVMITHAQAHEPFAPIDLIAPAMLEAARRARVPVIVHLDHGLDYSYLIRAIRHGFTSIMYDCSHLPFAENVRRVAAFTETAHALGITVEAEIGQMPSNVVGQGGCTESGKAIRNIEEYFTRPEEAAAFCDQTGVDLLAVSFGSVHGVLTEQARLDIPRLQKIRAVTSAALVMHGTSGVDDAQIKAAIEAGICKFNYYSGVATVPAPHIAALLCERKSPVYFHEIAQTAQNAMREQAIEVIRLFRGQTM